MRGIVYNNTNAFLHKQDRKHYAAMKEENKRKAANIVQLREKE